MSSFSLPRNNKGWGQLFGIKDFLWKFSPALEKRQKNSLQETELNQDPFRLVF